MPLLEAMECGCPVICAPYEAILEVVGDAAILVDSDDPAQWAAALLDVLPASRSALIEKGYAQARLFSWDRFQAHWKRILDAQGLTRRAPSDSIVEPIVWSEKLISQEVDFWTATYNQQQRELVEKEAVIQQLKQALRLG